VSTNGQPSNGSGYIDRPAARRSARPKHVVVVGGGIAGQSLCERLRERDPDVQVTLVCAEPHLPYDRVHLSDLLSAEEPSGPLGELQLRPDEWYDDNRIDVLVDTRVERIDLPAHELVLSNGDTLAYDRLALAVGSQPLMPPIPGIDLDGVYAYRGPADTTAIRAAAAKASHAAVIGGGLLGLEAARGVQAQGCPVTVVHLMDRLMERQLDAGAASMLLPAMQELDMEVTLERQTEEILGEDGHVRGLRFADGDELAADLVAVSIGIRPEKELAERAGIDCNRGIVVDDRLCTSEPDVVALGECAEHRGVVYGIVAPIYEHAKVAADTLLEHDGEEYRGSLPWAKLKVAEVDLVSIGDVEGDGGATSALAERREYRKIATRDGRMVGAILLGDTRGAEALLEAVRSGERIDDPLARLAEAAEAGPEDLPDEAQVCDCNGVCKGDIVRAVTEDGMSSKQEVMSVTRAGTGCGSCKPLVADIVTMAGGSQEPAYLCPCRKQSREFVAEQIMERGFDAVSQVSQACGTGRECGLCKPALAYLVSQINDNRHREERSARHINDRVHANIQNDGTFSVVPRMRGGVTNSDQLRRIADAADKYGVRMIKVTGGQRIDLLGGEEGRPARDLGGHRHALRPCLRQGRAAGQELRGHGLLPLRPRRLDPARCRARGRVGGTPYPCQGQVGGLGVPAQLRRGDGQGHRRRGDRGWLAGLRRGSRGWVGAQGRRARDGRDRRGGQAGGYGLPPVLPRARELQGAHLRLRPPRRPPGATAARPRRGQPGRPARALPARQDRSRSPRPVARAP